MQNSTPNGSNQSETIYDHPLYYDILFGWDRTQEAGFYESAFERFGVDNQEKLLEVACGTGQVGRELVRRGWKLTGLDTREPMLAFLREQANAEHLSMDTLWADMVDFGCESQFGGAFNPLSSLLMLSSDTMAESHLARMAAVLRSGGLYVLDLGFNTDMRPDAQTTDESWEETRGEIRVRADNDAVHVDHSGKRCTLPWGSGTHLRAVTSQWLEERIDSTDLFRIESWHPEAGRTEAGVSRWSLEARCQPPFVGRALVVLRRL